MKIKRMLILFLTIISFGVLLSGCSSGTDHGKDADANIKYIHDEYFDAEVIKDLGGGCLIVRDKNTDVLYLVVGGYGAAMITPIYNSDGTVKLYGE